MSSFESPRLFVSIRPIILFTDEVFELKDYSYKFFILYRGRKHAMNDVDDGSLNVTIEFDPDLLLLGFVLETEDEREMKSSFDLGKYHPVIVEEESYGPHASIFHDPVSERVIKVYFDLKFFNVGISIEEHCEKCPLFPLACRHYQYQPLLMKIFSYLPSSFLIGRIKVLNSYFNNLLEGYVHNHVTLSKRSFFSLESKEPEDFVAEFSRTNDDALSSVRRWNTFCKSFVSTKLILKSLSFDNENLDDFTIFKDYQVLNNLANHSIFEPLITEVVDGFFQYSTTSLSKERISVGTLALPRLDSLSFEPFKHLFSRLTKLSLNHISHQDLISLLNNIPLLREVIVIDLHFSRTLISAKKNTMKEHDHLELVQCGFVRTEDELVLFYQSVQVKTEEFAVDVHQKCKNLRVLELPYLPTDRFNQTVYYSCPGFDEEELTFLDKYLRSRFLDTSSNFIFPLNTKNKSEERGDDDDEEDPHTIIDETFTLQLGRFAEEPSRWSDEDGDVYSTDRDKCLIVRGIPFRVFFQVTNKAVFAGISCPYVKFAVGLPHDLQITHLDVETRNVDTERQESKICLGEAVEDFGVLREESGRPVRFKWGDGLCVPFRIIVYEFFKTREEFQQYQHLKSVKCSEIDEDEYREEEEIKIDKKIEKEKKHIIDELYVKQKYLGKSDSCEVEFDVRDVDLMMGSCISFFTLFDGFMDWKLEYYVMKDYPRRNLFFSWKFTRNSKCDNSTNLMVPGSFHIEITQYFTKKEGMNEEEEEGEEEEEKEEKKIVEYEERGYSLTTTMEYFEAESMHTRPILFCLPDDEKRTEKKVKMNIHFEIMDKVLGKEEAERHRLDILRIKTPISEEKLLEYFVPRYDIEEMTGIVVQEKTNNIGDPRRRVFRICGIDFYVFFVPFETNSSKNGTCTLHFQLSRLTDCYGSSIRLHGRMVVKVLEKNDDSVVISVLEKELGEDDVRWDGVGFFNELCPVDRERKTWKFLVWMQLDRIELVSELVDDKK